MANSATRVLAATFLVSGASIGAGMLAQPVAASIIGFVPSILMMFVAWSFMTIIALVLLEVCLWMPNDTHVISMAEKFLGKTGKAVSWVTYLFIIYLSLAAYILGSGDIIVSTFPDYFTSSSPTWLHYVLFIFVFGFVIEISANAVGLVNAFLFSGLAASYVFLIAIGMGTIEPAKLSTFNFTNASFILPLFITSFSFQAIVPSLATFLNRNRPQLRFAIICGTCLSFLIYLLWNAVVLGNLTPGAEKELAKAYQDGFFPIELISGNKSPWHQAAAQIFAFFAMVTSFIAFSWGLFDFLADGLKIQKVGLNRILLWFLVMTPPFLLTIFFPGGFVSALETTGGFGDTILSGIIPILMFWVGYYKFKKPSDSSFLKNRLVLGSLICCAVLIILLEASQL